MDGCFKYLYAEPMLNETVPQIIKALERIFISSHLPKVLSSDNAGSFKAEEFKRYLETRGVVHKFSTPYSPRSNSYAELSVRAIIKYLRIFCEDKPSNWHHFLQLAVSSHNTAINLKL